MISVDSALIAANEHYENMFSGISLFGCNDLMFFDTVCTIKKITYLLNSQTLD